VKRNSKKIGDRLIEARIISVHVAVQYLTIIGPIPKDKGNTSVKFAGIDQILEGSSVTNA
jgi:hypothetical protein